MYQLKVPEEPGQPIVVVNVHAWQYKEGVPRPVWVVRHWHKTGSKGLTGFINDKLATVHEGAWFIAAEDYSEVLPIEPELFDKICTPI